MNKITLKDEKGDQKVFSVLFEVHTQEWIYIAYASKKNKNDTKSVYFGKYKSSDKVFKNINKSEEDKLVPLLNKFRSK